MKSDDYNTNSRIGVFCKKSILDEFASEIEKPREFYEALRKVCVDQESAQKIMFVKQRKDFS